MADTPENTYDYERLVHSNEDGELSLDVLVRGVHCAVCIQKIESRLNQFEQVHYARLNFSSGKLSVLWEGNPADANEFVRTVEKLGYSVHPYDISSDKEQIESQEKFLLLCLGVAGFAMGNIMLISVGLWASSTETMGLSTRDLMHYLSGLIAIPAILFSGRPFFHSAWQALKTGQTNMDVPISLALILAGGMSIYETLNHGEHAYFDSAVMLMFFLLIGRYLDLRARRTARSTATDLLSTLSGFATVIEGDTKKRYLIREIQEGMKVSVATGEKFPIDGTVIHGISEVDTSLVTGETLPRKIEVGNEVYAGTLNLSSPVIVEVTKAAEDSLLSDIVKLMEQAEQGQALYVRLADKAARLYTPVVHILAASAFIGWWLFMGLAWQDSLLIAVTVLIITCPCALGLAVPVVQVLASSLLMKKGVLVKSGDALERLAAVDTVLLDKTGTLTLGHPVLTGKYRAEDLQLAASLAAHSAHPLSKAISTAYDGALLELENILEHPGKGLEALYQGENIKLGNRKWCGYSDDDASSHLEICLKRGNHSPVIFTLDDELRSDTADVIAHLKKEGLTPIMISGDRQEVAAYIAGLCGIDAFYADKKPDEKFAILEDLRSKGKKVLMVGDGLNDAPVLAGADASMAPGTALDMAQNAADIVFMGDRLSPLYNTFMMAKYTQSLVKQNFALAVLYNLIAVPLALFGIVTPMIAAIAMSSSSLLVIGNSFRLKWSS